mmetsp:Transcript_73530/g.189653  ORF Transcript_73530/g.189653 Transcript_73530/m.189653 type:complete len:416 (-) Transcript_73530:53-1300(-)
MGSRAARRALFRHRDLGASLLVVQRPGDEGLADVQGHVAAWAQARIRLVVALLAEGAVPRQGLGDVRARRIERAGLREDLLVAVADREHVLVQRPRWQAVVAAVYLRVASLLQHLGGAGHGWVEATDLPDVLVGVLGVGSDHLRRCLVGTEVDVIAALRLFVLQERADGLDAGAGATHAREADDVHDLIGELHGLLTPVPHRQALVHLGEDVLQAVVLDDFDGIFAQLLHLVDAGVEEEALHEARQDEEWGVGAPARERLGLLILDPHAEHHPEDRLADHLLHEVRVAEVLQRGRRPLLLEVGVQLLQAILVVLVRLAERESLVDSLLDRSPLAVRRAVVAKEDQDVRCEEIRDAGLDAAEGRCALLLAPEDRVAVLVAGAPDATNVPEVLAAAHCPPLVQEEGQAASPGFEQRD